MLPEIGQGLQENAFTILNIHMSKCNKTVMLLRRQAAIQLDTVLKHMGKSSLHGKDKILESFWGYSFKGYFSSNIVFRVRYLFDAGVFETQQMYYDYSIVLKLNSHGKRLIALYNQTITSEKMGSKTVVAVLTLIPGFGLLVSVIACQ